MPEFHSQTGPDEALACARLTIDLSALVDNWRKLDALSRPGRAGAVVKANAYGLGIEYVVPALAKAGCREFYVAQVHEGIAVRALAPDARIFVITGAVKGSEQELIEHRLIPLISSPEQLSGWSELIRKFGKPQPFGLHVDTGMNRSGLSLVEVRLVGMHVDVLKASGLCNVMSHPACADEPDHPMNVSQAESFEYVRSVFSRVESSFANSAAILTGKTYGTEITRPGIAVYGAEAINGTTNPMKAVVTAEARTIQIRLAKAGETVSYGATVKLERDTKIAVASVGYADGFHRAGGSGVPMRGTGVPTGHGAIVGQKVPILGRVTMDFTMFDVTEVPDLVLEKTEWIELFGATISVDDAAQAAGTIGYEMLTGLGSRYHRRKIN